MMRKLFERLDDEHKTEMFCDAVSMLDDEEKHFIHIKLSRIANKGHLSEDEAHAWVAQMHPYPKHWSKAETDSVRLAHGLKYDENDWYAVLNMMYSDFFGAVTDTTDNYVKLAKHWFEDKDIDDAEHKTFNYYHNVVKHVK